MRAVGLYKYLPIEHPESLRRAHARLESGAMIGKLVLGGIE